MQLDHARLQRRKHGREQARAILGLLDLPHPDCKNAFFDELREHLMQGVVETERKQQQRTIAELAATELQFGQYAGRSFEWVNREDRQYLEWLCDSSVELADQLGAYLEATGVSE